MNRRTVQQTLELQLGKSPFIVPFWVGVLAALQVLLITIHGTSNITFKGWGAIVMMPSHIMMADLGYFFLKIKKRNIGETRNLARGNAHKNEIPEIDQSFINYESNKNELFIAKLMLLWVGALLTNLKIDLKKEHLTWWAVGGFFMGYIILLALEGAHHHKWGFDDARADTRSIFSLVDGNEEDDDDEPPV